MAAMASELNWQNILYMREPVFYRSMYQAPAAVVITKGVLNRLKLNSFYLIHYICSFKHNSSVYVHVFWFGCSTNTKPIDVFD